MSTPSTAETFVTGDRVRYTISGKIYHGTIIRLYEKLDLKGWYLLTLEEFGNKKFVLPGYNMVKIEPLPPKVEKNPLAELSRRLQEKIDEVQAEIENHSELEEYHFDAGFTAGLRMAINEIESLTSKLTKNPDE